MLAHHSFAIRFMGASLLFLALSIWSVKKLSDKPEHKVKMNISDFNFSSTKKIVKKKDVSQIKKKKREIKKKMKALKPSLSANLKGASFGLDLAGLSKIDLDKELLISEDDIVMDEDLVDSKPNLVSRSELHFPQIAIDKDILSGIVEVRMLINRKGEVGKIQILKSNPKGIFDESTLDSLRSWRFNPAMYKGREVAIWAKQVVKFGE